MSKPAPNFRALFEAAPGLFLVLLPDLTIVAVSDAYLRATMTERDAIVGRGIFEVFPDNPAEPGATGVSNLRASLDRVRADRVADTMAVQKYDIRRPEAEGGGFEERYWSPVNSPVLGTGGELDYIIHRVEDVTEFVRLNKVGTEQRELTDALRSRAAAMEADVLRRATEVAEANRLLQRVNVELRRSESFLNSVIDNLPAMVFVKEATDLRFVRFNRAGEELLGVPGPALLGRNDYDFFPPDQADGFTAKDREALEGRAVVDIPEEAIDTAGNGRRILHTRKIPILDEHDRPMYLLGISEDITERKQAEDALRTARAEAERASGAKTEFLSRMSHELRTPLNAILGFSQLLQADDLTVEQQESVRYINRAGHHLLDLINEVLDIARIESGQIAISPEPVGIGDLMDELVALVGPLADDRNVQVHTTDSSCALHVTADRQRLKQVLLNLLSNAIKYNRTGGVVTLGCQSGRAGRVRISVTDTGYGMRADQLARLFRPFERLGAEYGAIEGTGMGLALSKGLVEAMGGTIGVDSTVDVGSTFWVELAITESQTQRLERTGGLPAGPVDADGGHRLVLLIEDNASNVKLIERVLDRRPTLRLMSAMQGQVGLELARHHVPDLILLDLHLPDLSGREVLERLRAMPETRPIPILVLSADATDGQAARLLESGAFGYLTKPLDVQGFLGLVDRALAVASEEAAG